MLGTSQLAFSQWNKTYKQGDTLFYNKWNYKVEKPLATQFIIIAEVDESNKEQKYTLDWYKKDEESGQMYRSERFFSKTVWSMSRNGNNTFFWNNGNKKEEGTQTNGQRTGIWKRYYENGSKKSEWEYRSKEQIKTKGGKSSRLINFWDPNGNMIVSEGKGNYYLINDDGDEISGSYTDFQKDGEWKGIRKDGSKIYREIYKNGELQYGESWDETGKRYEYQQVSERGGYSQGRAGLVKVIRENFTVPKEAIGMGIEGSTIIHFEVNKEGDVENIEVARKLCEPCDQEALRVMKILKKWKPGKLRGQKTRTQYNLPFRIQLTGK